MKSENKKLKINQEVVELCSPETLKERGVSFTFSKLISGEVLVKKSNGQTFTVTFFPQEALINGKVAAVEEEKNLRSSSQNRSEKIGDGRILSPMPGKILKVFVSVGQKVNKGEALLALEAMKMEHVIKASSDDLEVKKINCAEGQIISGGVELIELEKIK